MKEIKERAIVEVQKIVRELLCNNAVNTDNSSNFTQITEDAVNNENTHDETLRDSITNNLCS